MRRASALLLSLAAVPAVALPEGLTFSEALATRRPSPHELDAQALVAEARRAAAGAGSLAGEAPSLSALAGPRRDEDGSSNPDIALGIELPLLNGRSIRAELSAQIDSTVPSLMAGARALAAADLASAFVDAWLAQATAEVREQDLAATETWLAATRRRVEAGADPPYEPTLVAGERDRALVELVAVRRQVELAWGEVAGRAEVGPAPSPVTLDGLPAAPGIEGVREGSVEASIGAREHLALALARARGSAARSRWALQSEVAAEGRERLAHLGVAYRVPLRGERSAIVQEQAAAEERARRDAQGAHVALRARVAAARAALASSAEVLAGEDLDRAQVALGVRLAEGKERASQVLPLRRQLLEARLAGLAARAARARAAAELHYLVGVADVP